ncbi:MAG: hypothetical protein WC852_05175 [Candidatus Nanoarchaeia archaeon]|jgi:hypothetical protein
MEVIKMETKQFKPSRISIDVNITDKTNPEQLANNVEFFLNQLKERGIVASVGGVSTQFNGDEE